MDKSILKKDTHQIKSKARVEKFGEVFTNPREVSAMLDMIPEEMFQPERTFLEPCCGEGVFLVEVLDRKFRRCKNRKDYTMSIKSVYGMDIQQDNVDATIQNIIALCNQYFTPTKKEIEIVKMHIMMCDSLKVMSMMTELDESGGVSNG